MSVTLVVKRAAVGHELWRERHRIEQARRDNMHAAMADYNRDVYEPAIRALRERCARTGHAARGRRHDDGHGCPCVCCNQCGAKLEAEA